MSDADCDRPELEAREPGALPASDPVEPPDIPDGSRPAPDATPPQFVPREDLHRAICKLGSMQPQVLNGIFMNLLADHFSDPRYIWQPALRKYIWSPGPESKILITTNARWNDVDRTNDPVSIVLKRGAQQYQRLGIGGRGEVTVEGQLIHYMVHGSHTFTAVGGSGAETELLGEELSMLWTHETFRMMKEFFHDFQPQELGELGVIDELGGANGVPLTVHYKYESITNVRPIEPIHKVFSADVAPEV